MDMHEAKRVWQRELRQLRRDMRAAAARTDKSVPRGARFEVCP